MSTGGKKILPLQFVRAGLIWTQVARTDTKAIYAGALEGGKVVEWEVIRVIPRKEQVIFDGRVRKAGECYPCTAQWGLYGFTHNDEKRAWEKYNSIG